MARKKKEEPRGRGRPKKAIDWDTIANLAQHFMTIEQICAITETSRTTLKDRCQSDNGCTLGEFLATNRGKTEAVLLGVGIKKAQAGDQKFWSEIHKTYIAPRTAPPPQTQQVEVKHSVTGDAAKVFESAQFDELLNILDQEEEPDE